MASSCPCATQNLSYDVEAGVPLHRVSAIRVPVPEWEDETLSAISYDSDVVSMVRFCMMEPCLSEALATPPHSPITVPQGPQQRVNTFCPAIELDQAYQETLDQPVTLTVGDLKATWRNRQKRVLSQKYEIEVKSLLVQILGSGGKEEVLSQLLARVQVAEEKHDLSTTFYSYKIVVPKRTEEGELLTVPRDILEMTLFDEPFFQTRERVRIHDLIGRTDILDRLESAFGKEHFSIFRTFDKVSETEEYMLYEWTLHLLFHPNGRLT
jgi:hypothetical protein